jgi:hypothetical protein
MEALIQFLIDYVKEQRAAKRPVVADDFFKLVEREISDSRDKVAFVNCIAPQLFELLL